MMEFCTPEQMHLGTGAALPVLKLFAEYDPGTVFPSGSAPWQGSQGQGTPKGLCCPSEGCAFTPALGVDALLQMCRNNCFGCFLSNYFYC